MQSLNDNAIHSQHHLFAWWQALLCFYTEQMISLEHAYTVALKQCICKNWSQFRRRTMAMKPLNLRIQIGDISDYSMISFRLKNRCVFGL